MATKGASGGADADESFAAKAIASWLAWSAVPVNEILAAMNPIRAQVLVQPVGPVP